MRHHFTRAAMAAVIAVSAFAGASALFGAPARDIGQPAPQQRQLSVGQPVQKRAEFTGAEDLRAVIPGIPDARFFADSVSDFVKAMPTSGQPWLVLSGGGDDGAYGAGYLAGWSQSGRRPDFAVVTGASTGALMAPFAFLGPAYDAQLRQNYTQITAADVFEDRETPAALLDDWPLKKLIDRQVTPALLRAIAAEYRKGRRLFVITTNLDAGRPMVWNMGAIAMHGGEDALKLFRSVLLASSSIPGVFAPVGIDVSIDGRRVKEMHADGSIVAPFYVAPEKLLAGASGISLPTNSIYVFANTKLRPQFELVHPDKLSVLGRAISLALKSGMRMEIARTQEAANRLGLALQLITVPADFNAEDQTSLFDAKYMTALFARGERDGRALSAQCLSDTCRSWRQTFRLTAPAKSR